VVAILSAVYSEGGLRVAQTVTLIPGDGIGPDLTDSVKEAIGALDVEIE
jgi:isocitrate/isopropylmalate dehydrogenase